MKPLPVESKDIFLKTTKSSLVTTTNFTELKPHKIAIPYSEIVEKLVSCTEIIHLNISQN